VEKRRTKKGRLLLVNERGRARRTKQVRLLLNRSSNGLPSLEKKSGLTKSGWRKSAYTRFLGSMELFPLWPGGQKHIYWAMHLLQDTHKKHTARRQMKNFLWHNVTFGDLKQNIQESRGIDARKQVFKSHGEIINDDGCFVTDLNSYRELFLFTKGNARNHMDIAYLDPSQADA
jgi:hypothetical protein